MVATFTLELSFSLLLLPLVTVHVSDVGVQGLTQEGTGGDGSVASVECSILAMTFVQNTSPHSVKFIIGGIIQVINYCIKKMMEMEEARFTTIAIVKTSDAEEVIDSWMD